MNFLKGKLKKAFFENIIVKDFKVNRNFWKTIKPF